MEHHQCVHSGIDIIGDMAWGTHFCKFYETEQDFVGVIVPYFQTGLANNECCIWIVSDPSEKIIICNALQQKIPDFNALIKSGQMQFLDKQACLPNASAETASKLIAGFILLKEKQIAAGYEGLRVASAPIMTPSEKEWDEYIGFESKIDEELQHHKIVSLCLYSLQKCNSYAILDIVKNHQFASIIRDNKWEIIENSSIKMLKDELHKINQELERRIEDRTKKLEHAVHAREQFLAIASHELKTPLTSLRLYVDIMLQEHVFTNPKESEILLKKIQEQSIYLERLINSLLDITAVLKNGNLYLHTQPQKMDLSLLVKNVAQRFSEDLRVANCSVELQANTPVIGWWDLLRIDQVISNLITNVIKHASGGLITISVTHENQYAKLSVQDQGIGISAIDRASIFDLFIQGSSETSNKGFGVGLWLVKQIIEAHQGTIELCDTDEGSCFVVMLPLEMNIQAL